MYTIHEIGDQDERRFVSMDDFEGQTLKYTATGGPIELECMLGIAIEVASALEVAGAKGISTPTLLRPPSDKTKVLARLRLRCLQSCRLF